MDKKEKSIKDLLKELFMLTKKEVFIDAKLADGSIIRTDDDTFKVGSKVSLLSTDGTLTPVVDGSYTLADGSAITCKSGVIETIVPPTADATAPVADDATGATPVLDAPAAMADEPAPTAITPAPESSYDGDMAQMIEIIKNLTDRVAALEEKLSSTKMEVAKMAAAPAAKPLNSAINNKGTVADYLAEYKKEHMAKQTKAKENLLKLNIDKSVPKPLEFSKNSTPNNNNAPSAPINNTFDFGKALRGSSISA